MAYDPNIPSPAAKEFLHSISESLEENQKFLYRYARGTYEEVIELINDAIDWLRFTDRETYANRAIMFFFFHVCMPQSYAIHVDLLSGNLPVCFTELRLMVESLAKSCYADLLYPGDLFFSGEISAVGNWPQKVVSSYETFRKVGALVTKSTSFSNLR